MRSAVDESDRGAPLCTSDGASFSLSSRLLAGGFCDCVDVDWTGTGGR